MHETHSGEVYRENSATEAVVCERVWPFVFVFCSQTVMFSFAHKKSFVDINGFFFQLKRPKI
jgi:hypothetical protein